MSYISVPFTTDMEELVQQALTNIAASVPGWVPRDGNLEVLVLAEMARMASEAATVASAVPDTIFRYFGGLVGVTPNLGVSNQIYTTWALIAAEGTDTTIPAGTVAGFYYQGTAYQFQTVNDFTITAGNTQATQILMQAIEPGTAYNNVTTSTYLQLLLSGNFPLVASVQVTAVGGTSGLALGIDPESDSAFLDRLAAELRLLSPRPITPSDYAQLSTNVAGVIRSLALDGFHPFTNLAAALDALPTSSTAWTGVGNGTAGATGTPQLVAAAGVVTVTTSTSAIGSTTLNGATAAGALALVATAASLNVAISSSNLAFVEIVDATNGSEVVAVYLVNGASNKTWNLLAPTKYAHGNGVTLNVLQGVKLPAITGLNYNNPWFQFSALVQCGTDTTGLASPIVVSVATYSDTAAAGSSPYPGVYSSLPQFAAPGFDYTANQKLVMNTVAALDPAPNAALAASNPTPAYRTSPLEPAIASVVNYVLWAGASTNKTHKVLFTMFNQSPFDFSADDSLLNPTISDFNFLPDATVASSLNAGGAAASWSLPAGVTALPGLGIQYSGTGSALGAPLTAASPCFPIISPPIAAGNQAFTAFAYIDASNAGATYADIVLQVVNTATGSVIASATPASAAAAWIVVPFTLTGANSNADYEVRVVFAAGLNVPSNASVVATYMGVRYGTLTPTAVANWIYEAGWSWLPGGLYSTNTFNFPRSIVLAPVDANGIAVSLSIAAQLAHYLESYRELNFEVYTISPNYVPINVTWQAIAKAGYDPGAVQVAGTAALYNFLSPAAWAGGVESPPSWDSTQTTIHALDIAGILSSVPGVANVTSVLISISPTTPVSNADLVLPGPAPLPVANIILGSVSSNSLSATTGSV